MSGWREGGRESCPSNFVNLGNSNLILLASNYFDQEKSSKALYKRVFKREKVFMLKDLLSSLCL